MKALFLVFHGFDEANGISKKIRYQIKALKECGLDVCTCYYEQASDGHWKWMVDNNTLVDFGHSIWGKIKKRVYFNSIRNYIISEEISFIYTRSFHNANPFTIQFVKQLKKYGVKIVMEIPTYPYDQEYITLKMKLDLLIDRCFRHHLAKLLDGIITFSNAKTIFGGRTIRISNGIDFDSISPKSQMNDTTRELHLIGVAEIHYWHGYDRVIKGLAEYYLTKPKYKVYFHIVGELSGERERQEILPAIKQNALDSYVILYGNMHGNDLDKLFSMADMGIGSLGRHRSGITYIKTLKNREYAARGIPFIYSETDLDFDHCNYVLKVPANESPINIHELISFYHSQSWNIATIRHSIDNLSWKTQMQKVINETYK